MAQPRVLVLRAPGTNCDEETAFAFERAGAVAERVHINRLVENPRLPAEFQILCLPGGFSYGDDIAAGRILANQIRHHLEDAVREFQAADKLVLGICNGFQVLLKAGILLADEAAQAAPATLTWNDSGKFEDRWVQLTATGDRCVFLRNAERLYLPIAHAEGKFVTRDPATLDRLREAGHCVLRYDGPAAGGNGQVAYPHNPNGSDANVAGVCDASGRVFGLMPHPERHIDPTHHPHWTRLPDRESGDGAIVFQNAVEYFAG